MEEEAPVVEEAALQEEAQDEKAIQEEGRSCAVVFRHAFLQLSTHGRSKDDDDKESWEAWASDDETGRDLLRVGRTRLLSLILGNSLMAL